MKKGYRYYSIRHIGEKRAENTICSAYTKGKLGKCRNKVTFRHESENKKENPAFFLTFLDLQVYSVQIAPKMVFGTR